MGESEDGGGVLYCSAVRYDVMWYGMVQCSTKRCDEAEEFYPPDTLRGLASLAQMQAKLLDRPRDLLGEGHGGGSSGTGPAKKR